ncbi:MAG: hypothetical protein IJS28_09810 [Synergistaceae bacterium]|nr:hypothetical protein [Synergistaceae bacterium]
MKPVYTAKIEHTRKTLTLLFRTQYYTFEKTGIAVRFCVGLVLVFLAVAVPLPVWARALLLLPGTWLAVSTDFPAQVQADKVVSARKGKLPVMQYEFFADSVKVSGEGSMNLTYKSFSALRYDTEYCYLIISRESICMMEKPDNWEEFMKFAAGKTGLTWQKDKSFLAMNLQDFRETFTRPRQ